MLDLLRTFAIRKVGGSVFFCTLFKQMFLMKLQSLSSCGLLLLMQKRVTWRVYRTHWNGSTTNRLSCDGLWMNFVNSSCKLKRMLSFLCPNILERRDPFLQRPENGCLCLLDDRKWSWRKRQMFRRRWWKTARCRCLTRNIWISSAVRLSIVVSLAFSLELAKANKGTPWP